MLSHETQTQIYTFLLNQCFGEKKGLHTKGKNSSISWLHLTQIHFITFKEISTEL